MLQTCSNPACSVQFATTMAQCPSCGAPAPPRDPSEASEKAGRGPARQVVKTLLFAGLGAAPGSVWLYYAGSTQALVILLLGTLVGVGLSLPGVSALRVAGGTVGMIAAYNAPRSMRGRIMEHFVGDSEAETPGPVPQTGAKRELPDFLKKKDGV